MDTRFPFLHPNHAAALPIASGRYNPLADTFVSHHSYFPTLVEILIFAGPLSFVYTLILLALHKLPVVKER